MPVPTIEQAERAEATLDYIKNHLEFWNQGLFTGLSDWAAARDRFGRDVLIPDIKDAEECGTVCCLAGWHAFLHRPEGSVVSVRGDYLLLADGNSDRISDWSARDMGLPLYFDWAYEHPFDSNNSFQELEWWVEKLRECAETGTDIASSGVIGQFRAFRRFSGQYA